MFHVLTETVAEEMTPTSRALTLFDVAGLEVYTCCVQVLYTFVCTLVRVVYGSKVCVLRLLDKVNEVR